MFILTHRVGEIRNASGIYYYENLINGKRYVGQAKDVYKRTVNHENSFRKDELPKNSTGTNEGLWNAVKKYGRGNFSLYVMYAPVDELDSLEVRYIKELRSHWSEHGYNIQWGGLYNAKGVSPSKKTRELLRRRFTGAGNPFFGKSHTEESNERNRQAHLGKRNSESARKKMGDAARGFKRSTKSKYHGVTFATHAKKFRALITNGKYIHLGYFTDEIEAAKAFDKYVIENNLPHPLNFGRDDA